MDPFEPSETNPAASRSLAPALDALRTDALDAALDRLVAFWGAHRAPEVAAAIERLGRVVDARRPAFEVSKSLHRPWLDAAERARPSDVGRLLGGYRQGTLPQIEERVAHMGRWAPDPRVCSALLALSRDQTIGDRRDLWRLVAEAAARHADPRRAEVFLEPSDRLLRWRDTFAPAFRTPAPLASADAATLSEIEADLARRIGARPGPDPVEWQLVDAILADPDADEPRLVYADWLRERDDPRGEFIALDVALAGGKKVRTRREAHLKRHREAILGPLAGLVGRYEVFDRGLLDNFDIDAWKGALDVPADDLRALLGDLRWRTLRSLDTSGDISPILRHAPLDALSNLRIYQPGLRAIAERATPLLHVEVLDIQGDEGDAREIWESLAAAGPKLPALRSLEVDMWGSDGPDLPPDFFGSPLARQLESFRYEDSNHSGAADLAPWLEQIANARAPLHSLERTGLGASWILARDDEGRYILDFSIYLEDSADEDPPPRIADALRRLRPDLVMLGSAEIEGEPEDAAIIEDALAALPRA